MDQRIGLLACTLLALLFFGDTYFTDRTLVPADFLYQNEPWKSEWPDFQSELPQHFDLVFQFYPWADFLKRSVKDGEFPLWNPFGYLGTPFFANPQTAVLFPLTWIHLIFPLTFSFSLIFTFKLLVALLGMYLLLRKQQLSPESSLIGAILFSLSMHTISSLIYPYSNVTVLFPWVVLLADRLIEASTLANWVGLTIVLTMLVLGGQPQSALVAFLFVGLFAGIRILREKRRRIQRLTLVFAAFAISALLSAVQWIPSKEYFEHSMAALGPRIVHSIPAYPLGNLLTFVVPDFFGSSLDGNYWGFPDYPASAFYSSIVCLLLVPFAFRNRNSGTASFVLFCSLTLMASMGIVFGLPAFENLLDLPGLQLVRRNKFVFLSIFALASLAAKGAERLFFERSVHTPTEENRMDRFLKVQWVAPAILAALLLGIWQFRSFLTELELTRATVLSASRSVLFLLLAVLILMAFRGAKLRVSLVLLVVVDLVMVSYPINPRGKSESLYPSLDVVERLDGAPPRIYSLGNTFPPNTGMVYALQDVRAYDVMTPRRLFRFLQEIDPNLGNAYSWLERIDPDRLHPKTRLRRGWEGAIQSHGTELLDYLKRDSYSSLSIRRIDNPKLFNLLNVKYLLWTKGQAEPPGYTELQDGPAGFSIYLNPNARPAHFYSDWREANTENALQTVLQTDLGNTVIVESAAPVPPSRQKSDFTIRETGRGFNFRTYVVKTDQWGVLVEFERFYPGWRAYLDGQLQQVFPADFLFRGVFISPGLHSVEMRYEPKSVRVGLAFSLLGLVLLGFFGVWVRRNRKGV